MVNIVTIAQSALATAQAGLATTGHNIANAATPGYSRQVVVQNSAGGQNMGGGFIGKGARIETIKRIYSDYLGEQISAAQSSKGQLDSHYAQIKPINNLVADPTSGLTPMLQDFFASVQSLASNPANLNGAAARQSLLSSAQSLAARFQSLDGQLRNGREAVNASIQTTLTEINSYAAQISKLNDVIAKSQSGSDPQPANDLLDQRDHLVEQLSQLTKVSVVKQDGGYNIFFGAGQPLVVGATVYDLKAVPSPTDLTQLQVGIESNGQTIILPESALTGGKLGGLLEFRSRSLDPVQNALGRVAIGLAQTFNDQHRLGQDQNGELGGDFFKVAAPLVSASNLNTGSAKVTASIDNVGALTTSNYSLAFDGGKYTVTRTPENLTLYSGAEFPADPIDGVRFTLTSGQASPGDNFLIRPTAAGASDFDVLVNDRSKIAVASPILTATGTANTGTGAISAGKVTSASGVETIKSGFTLTYRSGTPATLSGFPAGTPVTVTANGKTTEFAAGEPVTFTPGATISVGGASFEISGAPANNDTFTVKRNPNSDGDNRNIVLLGALQSKNTLENGTTSYNGAYAQLVSLVGNKAHELDVNRQSETTLLSEAQKAQQSESGVNLDEEAANLMRYQQAYQAAGKIMQAVNDMFNVLVSLGR